MEVKNYSNFMHRCSVSDFSPAEVVSQVFNVPFNSSCLNGISVYKEICKTSLHFFPVNTFFRFNSQQRHVFLNAK